MRILLTMDGCYQIYDCCRIMSGDNSNMILELNNDAHILVEGARDT